MNNYPLQQQKPVQIEIDKDDFINLRREMNANLNNIKEYLDKFSQPFNVIAISETWINIKEGMDFQMDECRYNNRQNKGVGGVAIYVDNNLNFTYLDSMTTAVKSSLENITIKICKVKK